MNNLNMRKNLTFGIIGLGFISERHLQAIDDIGGTVIAGCDIDAAKKHKLPQDAAFVKDYRKMIDFEFNYAVIATPNDTHREMVEFFRDNHYAAICEKPLVIEPSKYDFSHRDNQDVFVMHQLRYMPEIRSLIHKINQEREAGRRIDAEFDIFIHRGQEYFNGWKGNPERSGGLLYNIGVHYIDLMVWLLKEYRRFEVWGDNQRKIEGKIEFELADVKFRIDITAPLDNQIRFFRICDEQINLNRRIERLHTESYHQIINGFGWSPRSILPSLTLIDLMSDKSKFDKKWE